MDRISNESFNIPIILCLGEHSMFLLDQGMQRLLGEIFYAHITRVVEQGESKGPEDVMRIELNEDRPAGVPAKITLISSEKSILLKHLRCYWETDYIWRLSKIAVLRVDQDRIDLKKFKAKVKDTKSKDIYIYPSNSSMKDDQKGYCYFFPNFLRKTALLGEYEGHEENVNYELKVRIEESKQLEYIRDDLRSKAETLAEEQLDDKESYCYLKNAPYMKKMNLVVDLASWKGWEIVLKAKDIYIALIILRRKFIPPLMDSGQDFVFIAKGGLLSRSICSEPANSIYTKAISNEYYSIILRQRCEALIMDEESANFYQLNLNITPESIKLAQRFIFSILNIMEANNQKSEHKDVWNELKKIPGVADKAEKPEEVIEIFMQKSKAPPKSQGYMKWCEKVCRYLAYALDGGLFHCKFTLEDVVDSVMGGGLKEIQQLSCLKKCIKQLLHVRKITEHSERQNEDLYEPITGLLKECANRRNESKKWAFNEKVMIGLVESGYLQRELDISGDVNVYPNLLIYLLQSPWSSIELKSVICRVTVRIDDLNEYSIFKPLIPYFLDVFSGKNYSLASQAAVSLINLSFNNRENKQNLFRSLQVIIKRLTTKDQKLLSYAILLLTNLASEPSRRKVIASDIRDPLIRIITGKIIQKEYLSNEVLSRALNALITISKDHGTLDYLIQNDELKLVCSEHINSNEDVVSKIVWLFEIMAEKSTTARIRIGQLSIAKLIERLKDRFSVETIKAIVLLLKLLITNSENFKIAIDSHFLAVLKQVYSYNEVQNDVPVVKMITSLIKNLMTQ